MNLTFAPNSAESVTGNVTISSSQDSSAVVSVTGAGVQAALTTTPSSVSFGNLPVGTSNSQTIRLSNTGTAVLTITQLSVTGKRVQHRNRVITHFPKSRKLNHLQRCVSAGSGESGCGKRFRGEQCFHFALALSGTGIAATQIVNSGSSSTQVSVTNTGNSNVNISHISLSEAGYSLSGVNSPVTLIPAQGLTFKVIFSPMTTGSVSGTVSVTYVQWLARRFRRARSLRAIRRRC